MGRTGSSSKRKSSKKNKSKISSETRRKKTNRRNRSKKIHRHDDPASSYPDESSWSVSMSSSDSEDDFKNKKARSRFQDDGKTTRKRKSVRNKSKKLRRRDSAFSYSDKLTRSVSSSDSEDDCRSRKARSCVRDDTDNNMKRARRSSLSHSSIDSPRVRKRKRSMKKVDSKVRKKTQRKKSRRDASISSSRDLRSCSTCRHGDYSSSGKSEYERTRGRSKEKHKRRSFTVRSETKISKNMSRSSSCCRHSDRSDDHDKEEQPGQVNSRRLRSVITVTKQLPEQEENEWDKDEYKEEIAYDQDDYPSSRSNESNDGGKKDLVHHSEIASDKRGWVETMKGKESFVSEITSKESKLSCEDRCDQNNGFSSDPCGAGMKIPEKENERDTAAGSGSDDLESILRQKALENLMRFRGGTRTNEEPRTHRESKVESNLKLSPKSDSIQNKSSEQELFSAVIATQPVDQNSKPTVRKDLSSLTQTEEKNLNAANNNSESSKSELRLETSDPGSTLKQMAPLHASPKSAMPLTNNINKSATETSQIVAASSSNNPNIGIIDARDTSSEPSCVKSTFEENKSRERQDEVKGSSQFEQKTMSVMRGGEMVKVKYKVYIPNKAPALARRRLQR